MIYIAVKTATFRWEGKIVLVRKGHTTVEEGHPLLDEHGDLFEPLVPTWSSASSPFRPPDVLVAEDMSADPDRPRRVGRPLKSARAEASSAVAGTEVSDGEKS